ncbi:MAG: extracellular solute-binding protein [Lachnospiraceae bacterium]|nr:extracellular solute-binding protein [Lachnospiraceae bacterium]
MKFNEKFSTAMAIAVAASMALAGTALADGDREVVTFFSQDAGNGAVEALIEAYEAAQDKYEINWVVAPKDTTEVKTMLNTALAAGSTEYDVVRIDTVWTGDMAGAGYLDALDQNLMADGLSPANFNPGSIQAGTYNAKTYAIPLYPDCGLLYFRSDIVSEEDAATLRSGDYTFEDLLAMAEKYAGEGGTKYGLAIQAAQYEGLVCNANEWTSNFTDISHGLELMKQACDADYTPDDILVYKESNGNDAMANGDVVFQRNWPSAWGTLTEETNVHPDQVDIGCLPGGACIGGWEVAINSKSEHKEGAWDFMKFATTGEGQVIFDKVGGYIPGYLENMTNEEILASHPILSREGTQNSLNHTIARPSPSQYAELSDALQISIHKYLSGETDLDSTAAEVEQLLKDYE